MSKSVPTSNLTVPDHEPRLRQSEEGIYLRPEFLRRSLDFRGETDVSTYLGYYTEYGEPLA
jgi:hypothetical protein